MRRLQGRATTHPHECSPARPARHPAAPVRGRLARARRTLADALGRVVGPASAPPARRRAAGAHVGGGLPRVARRLELARRQPLALGHAVRRRGLRPLGARDPHVVLLAAPACARPPATQGRRVDVYVCTYDEPAAVLRATLAGCAALTYPHTTYLLDDGRRPEIAALAAEWDAEYLTRPDNAHAKAGNINARCRSPAATSCSCSTPTTCRCPTRSTRSSATSTTSGGRARPDAARLLQPRLDPALRGRPPRAVALLLASSAPARTATTPRSGAARAP